MPYKSVDLHLHTFGVLSQLIFHLVFFLAKRPICTFLVQFKLNYGRLVSHHKEINFAESSTKAPAVCDYEHAIGDATGSRYCENIITTREANVIRNERLVIMMHKSGRNPMTPNEAAKPSLSPSLPPYTL